MNFNLLYVDHDGCTGIRNLIKVFDYALVSFLSNWFCWLSIHVCWSCVKSIFVAHGCGSRLDVSSLAEPPFCKQERVCKLAKWVPGGSARLMIKSHQLTCSESDWIALSWKSCMKYSHGSTVNTNNYD